MDWSNTRARSEPKNQAHQAWNFNVQAEKQQHSRLLMNSDDGE